METRIHTCNYCIKEYIPTRRKVQKFCSASCRVGSHRQNNKNKNKELATQNSVPVAEKTKIEQMSLAGVGNAAVGTVVGTLAVEGLKAVLIKEEDKPATKGDLLKMTSNMQRFRLIKNYQKNYLGQSAYFDSILNVLVYR